MHVAEEVAPMTEEYVPLEQTWQLEILKADMLVLSAPVLYVPDPQAAISHIALSLTIPNRMTGCTTYANGYILIYLATNFRGKYTGVVTSLLAAIDSAMTVYFILSLLVRTFTLETHCFHVVTKSARPRITIFCTGVEINRSRVAYAVPTSPAPMAHPAQFGNPDAME
jgi:hypothetical protein